MSTDKEFEHVKPTDLLPPSKAGSTLYVGAKESLDMLMANLMYFDDCAIECDHCNCELVEEKEAVAHELECPFVVAWEILQARGYPLDDVSIYQHKVGVYL